MKNGAYGISDIEGKVERVATSERGKRASFNGATGASDMAGNAAQVAVERSGRLPRYNAETSDIKQGRVRDLEFFLQPSPAFCYFPRFMQASEG